MSVSYEKELEGVERSGDFVMLLEFLIKQNFIATPEYGYVVQVRDIVELIVDLEG